MPSGRVPIHQPPGDRSCGTKSRSEWHYARGASGAAPFLGDLEFLKARFPSDHSKAAFMEVMRERMRLAAVGHLPWEFAVQMQCAPDVLELKLPDWTYSGGMMHTRLYYCEPRAWPGALVALRLRTKRPGPLGLVEQDEAAIAASNLLLEYQDRGFE